MVRLQGTLNMSPIKRLQMLQMHSQTYVSSRASVRGMWTAIKDIMA